MKKLFRYVIKVDGKNVWSGMNPTKQFDIIRKKYPNKEVGIAWESDEDVLVCSQGVNTNFLPSMLHSNS